MQISRRHALAAGVAVTVAGTAGPASAGPAGDDAELETLVAKINRARSRCVNLDKVPMTAEEEAEFYRACDYEFTLDHELLAAAPRTVRGVLLKMNSFNGALDWKALERDSEGTLEDDALLVAVRRDLKRLIGEA